MLNDLNRMADATGTAAAKNLTGAKDAVANTKAWQRVAETGFKYRGPLLLGAGVVASTCAALSFMSMKHRAGLYANDQQREQGQQR